MARGNGGSAVRVLVPRYAMAAEELLWFASQINSQRWRFFYARMAIKSRLERLEVDESAEARAHATEPIAERLGESSGRPSTASPGREGQPRHAPRGGTGVGGRPRRRGRNHVGSRHHGLHACLCEASRLHDIRSMIVQILAAIALAAALPSLTQPAGDEGPPTPHRSSPPAARASSFRATAIPLMDNA